jgi:hypothetical protein
MEDQANMEDANNQRTTRSKVIHDPQTDEKIKTLAKQIVDMDTRLDDVESIVTQLNDTSTQPNSDNAAPSTSTTEIRKLTSQIAAVEK